MTPELWWMMGATCAVAAFGELLVWLVPSTSSSNPEPAERASAKRYGLYTLDEDA